MKYLKIEMDKVHIYFIVQKMPISSVKYVARIIKCLVVREIFRRYSYAKKMLCGEGYRVMGIRMNLLTLHCSTFISSKLNGSVATEINNSDP